MRWLLTAAVMAMGSSHAGAQDAPRFQFDVPAESLSDAVREVAAISRSNVIVADRTAAGKSAPALHGRFTLAEALDRLLVGSGLHAEANGRGFVIRPGHDDAAVSGEIVVTGSRIAGAPVASTTISIDRARMLESGYNDLGSVVRSIPQSFGGGQNPGLGQNVSANSGEDVGGGSSINLRGLGSSSTLTLLDGQRVTYSSAVESIDVSAIPLGIIDRIDIVPDGSSALYGSDAVAGVTNLVLRPDMKGLEIGARVGGSTDGGNVQEQYSAEGGDRWDTGGFIVAGEFESQTAIWGYQRSYARATAPDVMLSPRLWHTSVAFNGHQALTDTLTFKLDGYYTRRRERQMEPIDDGDGIVEFDGESHEQTWGIAPSLKWQVSRTWQLTLAGHLGHDRVDLVQGYCYADPCTFTNPSYYTNEAHSIELSGAGTLFDLPGGPLKLAAGGGFQHDGLVSYVSPGSNANADASREDYYAFGELAIPLVGAGQDLAFIRSLDASVAVRYEHYSNFGGVATPKLGLIYAPNRDFDIKGSWGKSFRAPTLYEQYRPNAVYLYPAANLGSNSANPAAAALLAFGGDTALKPERATTWSAGITYHPAAVPGLKLDVSYFNVDFRNRIVQPIANIGTALSDPTYSSNVVTAPSTAQQAAVIASTNYYLDITGYPYDPANVVAIIEDQNTNAARQWIHGIDMTAQYETALGGTDRLRLLADATYINSRQQLSASQPITELAGTIFNPPHWRAKADLDWQHGDLNLDLMGNVAGGVLDNTATTPIRVSGMATMDVTLRYALGHVVKGLSKTVLTFNVQNLFNAKPTQIPITYVDGAPFDSTNYSPVGRFIGVGINTKW